MKRRLYFDNAATSWPKPPVVVESMVQYLDENGASAGRGLYGSSVRATEAVAGCRRQVAKLLGTTPDHVVLTSGGTHATNIALQGFLRPGDHVVYTQIEHNSVLRPLHWLRRHRGVESTMVPCDRWGFVDPTDVEAAMRADTRMVVVSHASNVTGTVQDLGTIGEIARRRGAVFFVDAAQSLGHQWIDVNAMSIGILASSGHKGCLGPLGTGILYIASEYHDHIEPLLYGGTGGSGDDEMPTEMPMRHEAGNQNIPAIVGLSNALNWLQRQSIDESELLANRLACALSEVPSVRVLRHPDLQYVPVISILVDEHDPSEVAAILDANFQIEVRSGFHCAPLIHRALQAPSGTVRFSLGRFHQENDIDVVCDAMSQIVCP